MLLLNNLQLIALSLDSSSDSCHAWSTTKLTRNAIYRPIGAGLTKRGLLALLHSLVRLPPSSPSLFSNLSLVSLFLLDFDDAGTFISTAVVIFVFPFFLGG